MGVSYNGDYTSLAHLKSGFDYQYLHQLRLAKTLLIPLGVLGMTVNCPHAPVAKLGKRARLRI
jgi:hypothetical protein